MDDGVCGWKLEVSIKSSVAEMRRRMTVHNARLEQNRPAAPCAKGISFCRMRSSLTFKLLNAKMEPSLRIPSVGKDLRNFTNPGLKKNKKI